MKRLSLSAVIVTFAFSLPVVAGDLEFNDCILKHMKGAKVDEASYLIEQACHENYREVRFVPEKRRVFNECLLEHLFGVESVQAVSDINAACANKYKYY